MASLFSSPLLARCAGRLLGPFSAAALARELASHVRETEVKKRVCSPAAAGEGEGGDNIDRPGLLSAVRLVLPSFGGPLGCVSARCRPLAVDVNRHPAVEKRPQRLTMHMHADIVTAPFPLDDALRVDDALAIPR